MMTERERAILEAGILRYIKTGEPVTSRALYEECDFGIKPAMIRAELQELCANDYFYQKHPSGGRIPTNKAYRFLVSLLMERDVGENIKIQKAARRCQKFFLEENMEAFVSAMTDYLGIFSVVYDVSNEVILNRGLSSLFLQSDFAEKGQAAQLANDVENLPKRLMRYNRTRTKYREELRVFIGKNPFFTSDRVSAIIELLSGDNGNVIVAGIGPIRMDYEKVIGFFRILTRS